MDDVVLIFFNDGFYYLEIIELLNNANDFQTSLSNPKQWLKDKNLKRRSVGAV